MYVCEVVKLGKGRGVTIRGWEKGGGLKVVRLGKGRKVTKRGCEKGED